ncbi:MAG: hypothetical protein CVV36_09320 [Candidatus Methanoperedenaceae archaeon HGW-Methanoperedenaceae-1]|jgi:NAD-dependent SIR2 family protein deacetylase|nr:MAG: hypothetical protein CVV36_09320 [Candidatus Methanoperedenaceae archaeon HGW-Methanoperedenaceae-1]
MLLRLKSNLFGIMIPGSKQSEDMKSRKEGTIPPFHPNLKSEKHVSCKHCGETYKENEIKRDPKSGEWVCKHYPKCEGTGWHSI